MCLGSPREGIGRFQRDVMRDLQRLEMSPGQRWAAGWGAGSLTLEVYGLRSNITWEDRRGQRGCIILGDAHSPLLALSLQDSVVPLLEALFPFSSFCPREYLCDELCRLLPKILPALLAFQNSCHSVLVGLTPPQPWGEARVHLSEGA